MTKPADDRSCADCDYFKKGMRPRDRGYCDAHEKMALATGICGMFETRRIVHGEDE